MQVLDVPVPQQMDSVPSKYILAEHVEQLVPQERVQQRSFGVVGAPLVSGLLVDLELLVPQERVLPRTDEHQHGPGEPALLLRVQQRTAEQFADVHVPLAFADVHVPLASGFGTFVEQVVGVPVLQRAHAAFASVSGRIMEQVVDAPVGDFVEQVADVPVPCVAAGFARDLQLGRSPSRSAAAWLEASQGQLQGVFRTFPGGEGGKVRRLGGSRLPESSGSPARPRRQPMAAPRGLMTVEIPGRRYLTRRAVRTG